MAWHGHRGKIKKINMAMELQDFYQKCTQKRKLSISHTLHPFTHFPYNAFQNTPSNPFSLHQTTNLLVHYCPRNTNAETMMIPSIDRRPSSDSSSALAIDSSRSPSSPPPPTPSLRGRHAKRYPPSDEDTDEEEKRQRRWSRNFRQRPPTERVLRPRGQQVKAKTDIKHTEEEKKKEKKRRKKKKDQLMSVSLTKEEIVEDLITLTGSKPPRRPKRRPKTSVQITLDRLFPGLGLPRTITSDTYAVEETE